MKKIDKINIKTLIFLTVIIFSMFLIFYLTTILNNNQSESQKQTQNINQIKVKAESKTYSKTISLNTSSGNQITPTPTVIPTVISPTESPTPEVASNSEEEISPTPTEIILAYNTATEEEKAVSPTNQISPKLIPESGSVVPLLAIFSVSLFIILVSLIY